MMLKQSHAARQGLDIINGGLIETCQATPRMLVPKANTIKAGYTYFDRLLLHDVLPYLVKHHLVGCMF